MTIRDKETVIQRWTTEKARLTVLADREIEPFLTAKERKIKAMLNNPETMKKMREQAEKQIQAENRAKKDAEQLRDIIPQQ